MEEGSDDKKTESVASTETQETFYDKKNSFFDKISSDLTEKAEGKGGKPDWKKERETNTVGLDKGELDWAE